MAIKLPDLSIPYQISKYIFPICTEYTGSARRSQKNINILRHRCDLLSETERYAEIFNKIMINIFLTSKQAEKSMSTRIWNVITHD